MNPVAPTPRALPYVRFGAVSLVLVSIVLAWRLGLLDDLSEPRRFADSIVALGPWGYVGFVVAYTFLQPFGAPGTIFVIAAPLLWPWPIAFALSMTGTMGASVVGFSFSRFVARDWVAARIPARFHRYDEALARNAFRTVFVLRLLFWMPQVLHGFFGVSRVRFSTHFWASLLGYLPPLFVVSYFTAQVFDASGNLQPRAFLIFGALVASSLTLVGALHLIERQRARRS